MPNSILLHQWKNLPKNTTYLDPLRQKSASGSLSFMNKNLELNISEYFSTEDERRAVAVAIGERIMKVLFFYFEEDQEDLDQDGAMDDFANYLWDISSSALSSIGISFIGKDERGRIIAALEPCSSVKDFLISEDIGEDDHVFYEDFLDDVGPDSGFGKHDNKILKA